MGLFPGFWEEVRAGSRGLFCRPHAPWNPDHSIPHPTGRRGGGCTSTPSSENSPKAASEASLAGTSPRPASTLALVTVLVPMATLSGDE